MISVIDDFAPTGLLRALDATWLPYDSPFWHVYDNGKRATKDPSRLPVAARMLLARMAEVDIETEIGVANSFPDVEYLHGAGMHQIDAGGSLGLHLDSERHPLLPWRREASGVLYLDTCEGGEFQHCTEGGDVLEPVRCVRNRLVLFATPGTWHRVAKVMSCRRSLCLFFWRIDDSRQGNAAAYFTQVGQ